MTRAAALFVLIMLIALGGCEEPAPEQVWRIDQPLELDPTDPPELGRWWGNSAALLDLRADGSFVQYDTPYPTLSPVAEGQWHRGSYAVIWLEPYQTAEPQRLRVSIGKVGERLILQVPDLDLLVELEREPVPPNG